MKLNKILIAILMSMLLTACDFLDTTPKGMLIPKTTEDFHRMLFDPSVFSVAFPLDYTGTDNVFLLNPYTNASFGRSYLWMEDFYKVNEGDEAWNKTYKHIYLMNVVIDNIMDSAEGTIEEKEEVLAEAKCWRALYYWYLQSLYAPAYDAATASTDLSVPLAIRPDLEAVLSRATVAEVTKRIFEDLEGLENVLPKESPNGYRPSKASVYSLRARAYFYMGEYDKASEQATLALSFNNSLYDMREWKFKDENNVSMGIEGRADAYVDSPEKLWFHEYEFASLVSMFMVSDDLVNSYNEKDLRFKFWFTKLDRRGEEYEDGYHRFIHELDYSFTVPEMMLIQAEALARKNDAGALDILNKLRVLRFAEEDFKPLTKEDGKDLLTLVLEERRLELCYSGLRWLDMKRLSKEGLYTKTLVRTFNGEEYKLEPNSKLYTFPIPPQVLSLNPKIVPNDRK